MIASHSSLSRCNVHLNPPRSARIVRAPCQQRAESTNVPGVKQVDAALLARLDKAKQYKASLKQSSIPQQVSGPPPPSEAPATGPTKNAEPSPARVGPDAQKDDFVERTPMAHLEISSRESSQTSTPGMFEPRSTSRGSSTETAYWLKAVLSEKANEMTESLGLDAATMRPEEFTRLKEARYRATQQVEIISVDKKYRPKVSTWGVFPRPDNISKAYGGGRTIDPGQELESEEEAKARRAKTDALLADFKRASGTLIDPEVEAECEALFREADELFRFGLLQAAYDKYDEITKKVVPKTRIGGLATLQKAITLDSLAKPKEAQALYKSLTIHPNPSISKRAKQMLFGFDAANFLKADTIDFSGKKQAWAKYFLRNSQTVYLQTEEEKEKDAAAMRAASAVAVAVMVSPIAAFAVAALGR